MNVKNELKALTERMFNIELSDTLFAAYFQELKDDGFEILEREYSKGSEILSSVLNEEQKTSLSKMENYCEENIKYSIKFGFTSGTFAGFQQFFVKETTKCPFEDFVTNQILVEPNMRKHADYYQRRCEFNDINFTLEKQLDAINREHLISIYSAWDNRLYGVLRHSFYLGYRYALSVIDCVKPIDTSLDMIGKTLLTEYELGFINTGAEQEQQMARRTGIGKPKPQP